MGLWNVTEVPFLVKFSIRNLITFVVTQNRVCARRGVMRIYLWEMSVDFIKGVLDLQKVKPTPLVMKI